MKEIKASKKAPKKVKRIASFKDVVGENFVALFHDDVAIDPDNIYKLFQLKGENATLVLDLHTGALYLLKDDEYTPVSYDEMPLYLKKGGKGSGKYKHLNAKNWRDLTDKEKALAIEAYHHPAPVERMYPTNVTPPDFEAYYIKISDADGEQSVYLRNVGQERWRVLFARSFGTRLGVETCACSEYTLKELLSGKGHYVKSGKLDCADRLLGIDEVQYLSAFMPNVHEKKRKNGLALAADESGEKEVAAYYWKEGKSIPCADEDYVLGLFTALKEIACCSVELEFDEEEEDIALSTDEKVPPADENGDENTPTDEMDETDAAPVEEAAVSQAQEHLSEELQTQEAPQEASQADEPPQEIMLTQATPEETAELLDAARRDEFAQAPQEPAPKETVADEFEPPASKAETIAPKPAEEKAQRKTEKKGLFSRLKNRKPKPAEKEVVATQAQQPLPEEESLQTPIVEQVESAEETLQAKITVVPVEAIGAEVQAEIHERNEEAAPAEPEETAEPEEPSEPEEPTEPEEATEPEETTKPEEAVEQEEPAEPEETTESEETVESEEAKESEEAAEEEKEKTPATQSAQPLALEQEAKKEIAAEEQSVSDPTEKVSRREEPVKLKRRRAAAAKEAPTSDKKARYDLPQLISAYSASGKKKARKKEVMEALASAPLIVPISALNYTDASVVYVSKQAYALCKAKIIPFVLMEDMQALLPDDENHALREGVMVKTVLNKGKTYIPVFADFKTAKQIFGTNELFGIFTLKNIVSHLSHNESVQGITINPMGTNLKIEKDALIEK